MILTVLALLCSSNKTGGKGEMINTPISLQDLRRSLYNRRHREGGGRREGVGGVNSSDEAE